MKFLLAMLCLIGTPLFAADVVVTNLQSASLPSVRLTGEKGDALVREFNGLKWNGTEGGRGHNPGFELRILDGKTALVDATLCFQCHNVLYRAPEGYGKKGFDETPSSSALLASLQALFPEH